MSSNPVTCVLNSQAVLGEGPWWDVLEQKLLWVDIGQNRVHRFDPATSENETWTVEPEPSFAIATEQGDLLVGTRNGIVRLDLATGQTTLSVDPEAKLATRFNDARCDSRGRLFAGTIADDRSPMASLYRISSAFEVHSVISQVINSNGLCWSADDKTMYYIDTGTRRIDAFDYDIDSGSLSNRHAVVEVDPEHGKPDGMTIDSQGMLWTGMWGGGAVCRWNPADGQLVEKIPVPCPNVPSCTFGGPNLDELYIVTARRGLSDEQLEQFPHSGGLFRCIPGVTGSPSWRFAS